MPKMIDQIRRLSKMPAPSPSPLVYLCTITGVNPQSLAVRWSTSTKLSHPIDVTALDDKTQFQDAGAKKPVTPMDVDLFPVDDNPVTLIFQLKNPQLSFFDGGNDDPLQAIAGSSENDMEMLVNPQWLGGTAGARNIVTVLALNGVYCFKYNLGIVVASAPPDGTVMPVIFDPNVNNTGWPPGRPEDEC